MSKKLRTLLKQNRLLEEKIFYRPIEGDWRKKLITRKELSAALACLATKIIENQSPQLSVLTMLNQIEVVSNRPLDHYEKSALQVVEILFNYLRLNTEFDLKFYHILNSLQLAFTRLALDDLSFLDSYKHPAVTFLEKIISIGYHFDDSAGKTTRFFVHAIELLVDRLASRENVSTKLFTQAHQRLDEYQASFDERVSLVQSAVVAKVGKETRQIQANFYTAHLIKSKTDGDEIAIFLLDFFENVLPPILHQIITKNGVQSKQCQQLLTDMDTISWSISSPFGDPDYKTRYDADVGNAMKRLFMLFEKGGSVDDYVSAFFIEVEDVHRAKLNGERVEIDTMISANIFGDDTFDVEEVDVWSGNAAPEKTGFDVNQLEEGTWYYLDFNGERVRSNLLMINDHTEKLYFINLSGELLKTIDFNERQFLTSNLSNFVVNEGIGYKQAMKALARELAAKLEVLELEYQTFKQQEIINDQQRKQLEDRAKQAVLDRLAVERKLVEQKRQLAQAKKQKEIQKIVALEKVEAERRFKTKEIIRKLGPGSMVAILTKDGRWTEGSLMIISRTTKRYIFADSGGKKIIEPYRNELVELIDSKKIKLIRASTARIDPMQSLVAKRRSKLSQRF